MITLKVPTIACEVCANNITKAIKNNISNAQVSIDINSKIVTVESDDITEDQLQKIITQTGHEVA